MTMQSGCSAQFPDLKNGKAGKVNDFSISTYCDNLST